MSIRNLSATQLSQHIKENDGASVYFRSGRHVEGPGFMVSDYGTETKAAGKHPTAEEITDFVGEHYDRASKDPEAAFGAWDGNMDVSRRVSIGAEARRRGRENLQEATYALPTSSLGRGQTPESLNREYGTDALLNMGRTPKAEREAPRVVGVEGPRKRTVTSVPKRPDAETPIYRDMADPSVQADSAWARSNNPNDFNLNEVDNDSWSMTDRNNERRTRAKSNYAPERKDRRRDNLGDVLRTINRGRTMEARGKGMTVDPKKGWHPKDAGPSKVLRSNESQGYVNPEALEAERGRPPLATEPWRRPGYRSEEQSPEEFARGHVQAAHEIHVQMVKEHGENYLEKFRARRGLKT
jgi:hypothetical protein